MNKDQIEKYFRRINFTQDVIECDVHTLFELHSRHMYRVPFENIDIWHKNKIVLLEKILFDKIIKKNRGGFCYELNYLFWILLGNLGFDVKMISAQIFDKIKLGPEFDHMALLIQIEGEHWLADVGFGDLFIKPLNINTKTIQTDESGKFKIEQSSATTFQLLKENSKGIFEKKYRFNTLQRNINQFKPQCEFKQYSKESYFVKNKICTLPISKGRTTLFNNKLIKRVGKSKEESVIESESKLYEVLQEEFQINLSKIV